MKLLKHNFLDLGKETIYFYLCSGTNPNENNLPRLRTGVLQCIMATGFLTSLILWAKIKYFKFQNRVVSIRKQNASIEGQTMITDNHPEDLVRIFSTILMIILSVVFQWYVNNMTVQQINSYPSHLIEHLFRYYWVNVMASFSVFIHYRKPKRIFTFWMSLFHRLQRK